MTMLDDASVTQGTGAGSPVSSTRQQPPEAVHATAPRIYNLFPLLVGKVGDWTADLPRIAAMAFDWVYVNPFHEAGFSGSLYAIKDYTRLDPRFRDESG